MLALGLVGLWAGPAAAHAILIASVPAVGGQLPAGPARIVLRFNSRIDKHRSKLQLRRDGQESTLPITGEGGPAELVTAATLTAGDYVVRWQVLAVDGHLTRGDVPFTATAP